MTLTETIDDFLESVKAHGDIVSYDVLADGSCDVVFQPALKNIKIVLPPPVWIDHKTVMYLFDEGWNIYYLTTYWPRIEPCEPSESYWIIPGTMSYDTN